MRRRKFLTLLGGAAAGWPLAARAQQGERVRRIVVLMTGDDAEGQARMKAFLRGLQQLGWIDGSNVRIEARWTAGKADNARRYVAELAALTPDVIMATGSAIVGPLLQSIRGVPIVFAQVPDPVGAGFVESLARPGGNATGFISFEYGLSAKWLELLKEIARSVTRVAVLRDPGITGGIGQWAAIQTVAPSTWGESLKSSEIITMKIAFTSRSVAALQENDLANRRPPTPSLTTTRGGTIAAVYSRCQSQRDLRIRHGQLRSRPVDRLQIPGSGRDAAVAGLEDVSSQPRAGDCRDRPLRGPDPDL